MYDPQELEAFVRIVRSGSLTVTARELGLPKSTLSRRIRHLEKNLGQPLLLRQSRHLAPNEAGKVFYRYSKELLALMVASQNALDELREEVSGSLVLYCHEAIVRGWFSKLVESFMAGHEDVQVLVQTCREVPDSFEDGACLWIGALPDSAHLRQEKLGSLSQSVYGSPAYFREKGRPESPGQLSGHPWVDLLGAYDQGLSLWNAGQGNYPIATPRRRLTVDQLSVQGDAIAAGRGVGLMPDWLVQRRLQAHPDTLEPCLPAWRGPDLPVTLLMPHGHLSRRTRAFAEYLRASVPEGWTEPCEPGRAHTADS